MVGSLETRFRLPSIFERSFSSPRRREYNDAKQYHERRLIRVDENGKICWNFKHYHALLLLCAWIGFRHIIDDFEADGLPKLLRREKPLWWICKKYCDASPAETCPRPDEVELQVAMIMRGAPKLRALLSLVGDHVILNQEKLVLVASLPGQVVLIYALLNALRVSVGVVHAGLSPDERTVIQDCFKELSASPMVYLTSYSINSSGINLQEDCHRCILFDVPPSLGVGLQAAARVHRVGQTELTELITFVLSKSFNDRQVQNNLRKAILGITASLDNSIFKATLERSPEDPDETVVTIADWGVVRSRPTIHAYMARTSSGCPQKWWSERSYLRRWALRSAGMMWRRWVVCRKNRCASLACFSPLGWLSFI
jgi:Helicase conserved C-terminal domain